MRLGIFGGTFDPIHLGHLVVAEYIREEFHLDRVLFIPAGQPWFKTGQYLTDGRHRFEMVRLATAYNPRLQASDIELRRGGPTYTIDTLTTLRDEMGDGVEFNVIVGTDALNELHRWHRPTDVLKMATVVGVTRPGATEVNRTALESIREKESDGITVVCGPIIDVSATDIRRRVAGGVSIKCRVPQAVEEYIYRHRLYRGEGVL